ncbi:hypothetical protein PINS_up015513 [Pythium insidiosum]|nr:hypothetical protein PINS_up015513 [Pythium insidiosum]
MTVLQERIERAEKKLKTKQKRFRTNKKAEITTLRKRVNFVTADMEIAFMSSEDVLSALFPMVDRQFELQTTQGLLKRQIVETEAIICDVSSHIVAFNSSLQPLDTNGMRNDLMNKEKKVEALSVQLMKKQVAFTVPTLAFMSTHTEVAQRTN